MKKTLHSFVYHGKTYYCRNNLSRTIKGDKVPTEWSISMLKNFFDAQVTYDYDKKTINIEFTK